VCEKAISRSHAVEFGPADGRVNARTSHPPCHSILLCPALDALLHVTAHRIQPPAHPVDCCPFPPRDSDSDPLHSFHCRRRRRQQHHHRRRCRTPPRDYTTRTPPAPHPPPASHLRCSRKSQDRCAVLCCAVLYHTRLTTRPPAAQSTSYRQFLPKPSLIRPNPAPTTHLAHPHARSQQHHQTQPASAPRPRTPNPRTCML
jgi:hypothetical protein